MSFIFKKQIFGFMDLLRFKKMVPKRRQKLAEGSPEPLPKTYRVNETAKILHPGFQRAKLVEVVRNTEDTKTYTFETENPFYFRAGQYVTLGCNVGESTVSRPYAISSAPAAALQKRVSLTVKKCGFFSGYLFDCAKAGDEFIIGDPSGDFCFEPVKDSASVVALAGGSGITPFYSMAQAIADGTENHSLTIFYGAKKESELIFKDELDALAASSDKINVIYVLSDEDKEGYEHGFIGAQLLNKYVSGDYTVMMCGPAAMYAFADKELATIGILPRRIKKEANCVGVRDVAEKKYKLTVHIGFDTFTVSADARETILTALERAGLKVPAKCRAGGCGFCHSKLVSGTFSIAGADKRRLADAKFGYIHPCCSYPDSDMELIVPKVTV
ncbi:MAG TPA: iron-sulfur cluster-binding domain-containing protein [Candidatus Borkfalkia excrementigallinarum]|uniref:Iron-sulfur cluster-binding domain-containing protein n=1 Tax=Candidatus Borkfalkia excrementigallinarum TaxID=2838506 RepID=A0A9D1ZUD7_9FIRM|nr:iron-sulfur cluster-binding domain-containing protein [Candidatus Borkfalkia excrementigallinarum]